MLKCKGLLASFVLISQIVFAQSDMDVQGTTPNLYLMHTVVAKENWYSVGRLYNLNPKTLVTYNGAAMTKPLIIGQVLKIPLGATNFSQNGTHANDEVFVPVFHTVQEKEWMYRISQNNNKVPVATLEKWNSIKNEQLRPGMRVVVGYLKVKTGQSALAAQGNKKIVPVTPVVVAKNDPPVEEKILDLKKDKDPPNGHEVKKDEASKQKEESSKIAVNEETKSQALENKPKEEPVVQKKEDPVVQKEEPKNQHPEAIVTSGTTSGGFSSYRGGFFKPLYAESGKDAMGNAGVFKSTSGWKDGKYYALMNNVPVGTIVKVTFSSTNKSVFAKVLGQLPEMRESTGLMLRLSDAAASELGAENGKFYVDVKY